jgi:nucleotide-binding universal stress UspA family protein
MSDQPTRAMRVMLGSDDSPAARAAEAWLARARWAEPPVVDVVSVARRPISYLGWGPELSPVARRRALAELRRIELERSQQTANEVGERLQGAGLLVHAWAREGDPAEALLDAIQDGEPDLVAVGPGNRPALARLFVGSVSRRIIESAQLPILVARGPLADDGPLPARVAVLAGELAGGRPAVTAGVRWLSRAGWLRDARVTLVGFVGTYAGIDPREQQLADELVEARRGDATRLLDALAAELPGDVGEIAVELLTGDPLEASLAALAGDGHDLVVVGRAPVRRGTASFGERIATDAPVSVLLVPAVLAHAAHAAPPTPPAR